MKRQQHDIEKLMSEVDWKEIQSKIANREYFEFKRSDKTNKVEIYVDARFCDNGIWQDNYICSIGGRYNIGGASSPYQRVDFMKLRYDDVCKFLAHAINVEQVQTQQVSLFSFM